MPLPIDMTLDEFNKQSEELILKFKADLINLMAKGIEAKLDQGILQTIVGQKLAKFMGE